MTLKQTWILIVFGSLLAFSSCGDVSRPLESAKSEQFGEPSESDQSVSFAISLNKITAGAIASAEAVVSGAGIATVTQALVVDGQSITGTVFGLSAGSRTFTLNAYDSDGKLTYSGSAEVDLVAGETAQVAITLTPVPTGPSVEEIEHPLPDDTLMTMVKVSEGTFIMGLASTL